MQAIKTRVTIEMMTVRMIEKRVRISMVSRIARNVRDGRSDLRNSIRIPVKRNR